MKYTIFVFFLFSQTLFAKKIRCQKEAEAFAILETKKKGNMPNELLSIALPTEERGKNIVVYVGARANYNYFEMYFNKQCKLVKLVDVEFVNPK